MRHPCELSSQFFFVYVFINIFDRDFEKYDVIRKF